MRKNQFKAILLLTCLPFWSCQKQEAKPNDILDAKDIQKVLIELHTLEAIILEKNYNLLDSAQVAYQTGEKKIFEKLKIPYKRYKRSYDHYLRTEPQQLEKIYAVVIDSLKKREQKVPDKSLAVSAQALQKKDSLPKKEDARKLIRGKRREKFQQE
jgi:hypothetical protein